MSDIRDVLQARTSNLAAALRNADEFDLASTRGTVKRKRAVRATVIGTAAAIAFVAVGAGAWAGYGAWNVGPATSPSPSATPSGTGTSTSPSPTPSTTVGPERVGSQTDAEALALAANPRTTEVWTEPAAYETDLDLVDLERYFLAKVGEHGDADIVAVAPRYYEVFSGGRQIEALLEVDAAGARFIECPFPAEGTLCPDRGRNIFGADVSVDPDTFYDTLNLPGQVAAQGGVTLGVGTNNVLGDASAWTELVTEDPDFEPRPWANTIADTPLGETQSSLVRAYGTAAVPGLNAFDYAIRTPFGSYVTLLEEGISGMDAEGFSWDDGSPVVLYDEDACSNWGDGACPDRWLSAEQRCFPLMVTEDPDHVADDWVAAGVTSDGRTAYLPVSGGNATAESVYTTMHDSSWDAESNKPDYLYSSYAQFLKARPLITFELDDGRWIVALAGSARNNPYECA